LFGNGIGQVAILAFLVVRCADLVSPDRLQD
jgi:hypothetical protein